MRDLVDLAPEAAVVSPARFAEGTLEDAVTPLRFRDTGEIDPDGTGHTPFGPRRSCSPVG